MLARGTFRPVYVPPAPKKKRSAVQVISAALRAGPIAYSLSAAVGAFTLTGQAATLTTSKQLTADVGAFTLAGQSATFRITRVMTGGVGSFALTGKDATLRAGKTLIGGVGAFALTGKDAALNQQRRLTSAVGAFALTGKDAILLKTKLLIASAGSFTLTGRAATFLTSVSQIGKHQIALFPNPVNAAGPIDANIVRSNDNITAVAYNAHDADTSIHIQSGLLSVRPASATEGTTYFCTDTRDTYTYVSSAWVQSGWAHWYGSFSDTTDQTIAAANTATRVTFNTTDVVQGFSLVSTSRMTAAYAGTYNFQWSGQFVNSDSAEQDVEVWIRINGVDLVGSTGRVSVPKRHGSTDGHILPGWNYYLSLAAGNYVELYWAASNTTVSLQHGNASAWAPSTASIIATLTRV